MDNIIKKHVGIFDFWSVFCAGIVVFTSFVIVYGNKMTGVDLWSFPIFLYIVFAYVIGLILYDLSSVLIDCEFLKLSTVDVLTDNYKERKIFKKYYEKYLLNNKLISDSTKRIGFQECYNHLKYSGLSDRIDKLHALYGMARGISLGYSILSLLTLINLFVHLVEMDNRLNIISFIAYIILMATFYAMTKKYFYRWIEWVLIEYQYSKKEKEDNAKNECKT